MFLFLLLIPVSYSFDNTDYLYDIGFSIVLLLLIFWFRKPLKLSNFTFILLIFAIFLHTGGGVIGFYNESPVPISWDYLTHFIGVFAATVTIFPMLSQYFSNDKKHNILIVILMVLLGLGVGALIEQIEFISYNIFGEGTGFFRFGGLGDTSTGNILGGYINSMLDLQYNFLGAVVAVIIMLVLYRYRIIVAEN